MKKNKKHNPLWWLFHWLIYWNLRDLIHGDFSGIPYNMMMVRFNANAIKYRIYRRLKS